MTFQAGVVEVVGARETRKIDKDTIEITVRGRPITVNIPLQYQADYDINKEVSRVSLVSHDTTDWSSGTVTSRLRGWKI